MKTPLFFVIIFTAFSSLFLHAEDAVAVYSDYNPREYGRAMKRLEVLSYPLREFSSARTLSVSDPDGVLTAVLISQDIIDALGKLLDGFHERWLSPAWFWSEQRAGRRIFSYYDNEKGVRFSFSAERPGPKIFEVIDRTYSGDAKTRNTVRALYSGNYVIRVHAAENIIDPWLDDISYAEALVSATLAGDIEQPLWGIHDGFGLLKEIPERVRNKTSLSLVNYRQLAVHEAEYLSFVGRISQLSGGFVRNLHDETMKRIERSGAYEFQLPEEIIVRGKARESDVVLLYFDVLTRKGFQAKYVAVRKSPADDPVFMTLYREGPRGNWGVLTGFDIIPEVSADYRLAPSLVLGAESAYAEIDPLTVLARRKIPFPETLEWKQAPD